MNEEYLEEDEMNEEYLEEDELEEQNVNPTKTFTEVCYFHRKETL